MSKLNETSIPALETLNMLRMALKINEERTCDRARSQLPFTFTSLHYSSAHTILEPLVTPLGLSPSCPGWGDKGAGVAVGVADPGLHPGRRGCVSIGAEPIKTAIFFCSHCPQKPSLRQVFWPMNEGNMSNKEVKAAWVGSFNLDKKVLLGLSVSWCV